MMTLMKSGKVLPLSPALLPEKQMRALHGLFPYQLHLKYKVKINFLPYISFNQRKKTAFTSIHFHLQRKKDYKLFHKENHVISYSGY